MPVISSDPLANGLQIHRVPIPGTRAATILVAFDAGARTEREEENGMAHFLEHLVFKGGEKYDDYRKVNETAEHLGAVLNAYTSHDVVAFHITCRAEVAGEALDLLTDFVGRPRIDQEELDRERGVVIQEIARAHDQPSVLAEHLIDRAAFGDHPLGARCSARRSTCARSAATRSSRSASASGRARAAARSWPATSSTCRRTTCSTEAFGRFPAIDANGAAEPAPGLQPVTLVEERESRQSHLRMSYRPSIDVTSQQDRAALQVYSTLLGGSMGSRLFDEIREQRGLAYSVYALSHAFSDAGILQLSAGLESGKCVEAYHRMREIVEELRADGPTQEETDRARAYAAGRAVLAFENTNAVARHVAQQQVVFGGALDPDLAIEALDAVTLEDVTAVARGISEELSVACVGPHTVADFE